MPLSGLAVTAVARSARRASPLCLFLLLWSRLWLLEQILVGRRGRPVPVARGRGRLRVPPEGHLSSEKRRSDAGSHVQGEGQVRANVLNASMRRPCTDLINLPSSAEAGRERGLIEDCGGRERLLPISPSRVERFQPRLLRLVSRCSCHLPRGDADARTSSSGAIAHTWPENLDLPFGVSSKDLVSRLPGDTVGLPLLSVNLA